MFKFIKSQIKISQEKKEEEQRRIQEQKIKEEERKKEEERIALEKKIQEENKRKEEEQRIQNEIYQNIKENLLSMCYIGIDICTSKYITIDLLESAGVFDNYKNNTGKQIIIKNIFDMYKLIRKVYTIDDFNKLLDEKCLLELTKQCISDNFKINFSKNKIFLLEQIISIYMSNNIENIIINDAISQKKEMIKFVTDTIVEDMQQKINSMESVINSDFEDIYDDELIKIKMMALLTMYARAFNKVMLLEKYYKPKFIANRELYNISENLFREIGDGTEVLEKLYPIYERFYSDSFNTKVSKEDLFIIYFTSRLDSEIEKTTIAIGMDNIIDELNISNCIGKIEYIENLIKGIVDSRVDFLKDSFYMTILMHSVIKKYINELDFNEIMELFYSRQKFELFAEKYKENIKLQDEKEKYLKGDFSNEKLFKLDKERFNNIITGEEFEIYLKNFFEKLGYNAELTKTTGDQGADLIIEKDLEKIVVQAKFYSTPVGNKAVQEVVGAIKFYGANYGMVVTNNTFTKSAVDLASANNIELIDGLKLNELREEIYL